MTRKSLCSRLKSGLEHSCWTGSPPVCERLRATKADLFRAGLQVQRASAVNRRAKRLGQINNTPVRNIDHFRSYFRKELESGSRKTRDTYSPVWLPVVTHPSRCAQPGERAGVQSGDGRALPQARAVAEPKRRRKTGRRLSCRRGEGAARTQPGRGTARVQQSVQDSQDEQ